MNKIEPLTSKPTQEMMALLLDADPNLPAVQRYLVDSHILICKESEKCIAIAVLEIVNKGSELKNISVAQPYRGKGIAKLLIKDIKILAKQLGAKYIEVGTGNSSLQQLNLYQKCGFRMHDIYKNYFESYPEPIFENGIRCIDMVRLRVDL